MRSLILFVLGVVVATPLGAQTTEAKPVTKDAANAEKPARPKSGGANVITADEIAFEKVSTAYEAVQRLRPAMLRKRQGARTGDGPSADIQVYVDNRRLGPLEMLNSIPAETIKELRYLGSTDATLRFGINNTEGAILITTKK